jgi:arylsulfatase A-like enzyme
MKGIVLKKKIFIIAALCLAGILIWFVATGIRSPRIRHVVLISMDTCRADHLSCYGYPRETTPNLDALAAQATRFASAVTPVPITLSAHCSMLTGKTPPAHGVHHNFGYQLADSNETLAEILKADGFKTAAIVSTYVLDTQFGLNQGFDIYYDKFGEQHRHKYGVERFGDETTRIALDWLDANRKGKSFLFLHYYDAHYNYAPPEPYATEFADDPYAGEIAFDDHCIGQVIQKLKEIGWYDSTLLIIVGDHGEMLGEHGEETHTYFIYESAVKVPLIVKMPGQKTALTVPQPVGLIDIVPTICSLLKIDAPEGIQGVDLSGFLRGTPPADYKRYLYSESVSPTRFGASSLMGISDGRWRYIQAPRPELYDVISDRQETNNLVEQEFRLARIFADKVAETLEQSVCDNSGSRKTMDAESIKRLESLGYVAGKEDGKIVFDETKADPKDFVHLINPLHKAKDMIQGGRLAEAKAILDEIAPQAPGCLELFTQLGDIAMAQQDYESAVVNYRRAYQIDQKSISAEGLNNLAWLQAVRPSMRARDLDEALKYAETVCSQTQFKDPHTLDTLSVVYAARGDFQKAVETAQAAWGAAMSAGDKKMMNSLNTRLALFRESKPYVEE